MTATTRTSTKTTAVAGEGAPFTETPPGGRLRQRLLRYSKRYFGFALMFVVLWGICVFNQLFLSASGAASGWPQVPFPADGLGAALLWLPHQLWAWSWHALTSASAAGFRNILLSAFLVFVYCYALYNTRIITVNEIRRFLLVSIIVGLELFCIGLVVQARGAGNLLLDTGALGDCFSARWWIWGGWQALFAIFLALPPAMSVNLIDMRFAFATAIFEAMMIMVQVDLPAENSKFFYYALTIAMCAIPCYRRLSDRREYFKGAFGMACCIMVALPLLNLEGMHGLSRSDAGAMLMQFTTVAVGAGLATALLCYNGQWLFECIFDLTTPTRLAELHSNTELMRRMRVEAPGTYAHVNAVADLAVNAAAEIGVNAELVSAMALYHDIGKLKAPQYFAENQNGRNPHDNLTPRESAQVIIRHVDDGLELAKEYHISKLLWGAIESHHGNSVVQHFYRLACRQAEESGQPPPSMRDFQYQHRRPVTREEALVSLADACEAAVRALLSPARRNQLIVDQSLELVNRKRAEDPQVSEQQIHDACLEQLRQTEAGLMDAVQERVAAIFQSRFRDGQLDMAQLTTADLHRIQLSFINTIRYNQHTRPEYLR